MKVAFLLVEWSEGVLLQAEQVGLEQTMSGHMPSLASLLRNRMNRSQVIFVQKGL